VQFFAGMMIGRGRLAGDFGLGVLLFGLPLTLVPAWRNEGFALLLLTVIGVGNTLADVSGMTLLQRFAPEAVLARVFGILESVLLLTVGLGAIVAPVLVSAFGIRAALVIAGLLLPVLVIPAWPVLRRLDRGSDVPVHRLERLRAIPFLAALPEATIEQLARAASEEQMKAGDEIVRQGSRAIAFTSSTRARRRSWSTAGQVPRSTRATTSARSRSSATCHGRQRCGRERMGCS
jgi:Major Facilitator Superfamily.